MNDCRDDDGWSRDSMPWHHFLTCEESCSGLLGWGSSLQPCFCLRLPQDQNYTKLSSTWPSVAMEIHGSLDCWCASTSMSQSESVIWIHLICAPLRQTWHLRVTWCLSITTKVLQKERKKRKMAYIKLPGMLVSYIFFVLSSDLLLVVVIQQWPTFLPLDYVGWHMTCKISSF